MFTELRLVAVMDAKVPSQSTYQVLSRWIVEFPTFDLLYHLSDQSKLGIISTFVLIAVDEVTLVEAQAAGECLAEQDWFGVVEIEIHHCRTSGVGRMTLSNKRAPRCRGALSFRTADAVGASTTKPSAGVVRTRIPVDSVYYHSTGWLRERRMQSLASPFSCTRVPCGSRHRALGQQWGLFPDL
jgi:hypothetical protein